MDAEARKAALNPSSTASNYKRLKSARVRTIQETARHQWRKEWDQNPNTAKALKGTAKKKIATERSKLYNEISNRSMAAKIAQLHIRHGSLNHYLHYFGIRYSLYYCECSGGKKQWKTIYRNVKSITNNSRTICSTIRDCSLLQLLRI